MNGQEYRAVFTNTVGVATSGVATLTVTTPVTLSSTGPDPSNAAQSLTFDARVNATVPDGEMIKLEDASDGGLIVATAPLANNVAELSVSAGTLLAGIHNLIAIYPGDASILPGESAPYAQVVQVMVTDVVINGNLPALAGPQRSMLDSIVYTFSEPVNLTAAAGIIVVHPGRSGTIPTLNWAVINPNSDGSSTQWAVSFSGAGVAGNSIANGIYDITLNPAYVTSDANPSVEVQPRGADTFFRLFGDINGDGVVNAADNFKLKAAMRVYNAALDDNDDGIVNAFDNLQFKNSMFLNFAHSGVYTI
jgi:hypothetical protein